MIENASNKQKETQDKLNLVSLSPTVSNNRIETGSSSAKQFFRSSQVSRPSRLINREAYPTLSPKGDVIREQFGTNSITSAMGTTDMRLSSPNSQSNAISRFLAHDGPSDEL
jgi:hypothetical protein